MTSDAGDARLRVRACDSRREGFRLMAGRAIGIHLFTILNTQFEIVAGSAGIIVRLFGNRGR